MDFLHGHGGRFDQYEFPHSDLDFDDPAVIDMIARDWMGRCVAAAEQMDDFFSHRG